MTNNFYLFNRQPFYAYTVYITFVRNCLRRKKAKHQRGKTSILS